MSVGLYLSECEFNCGFYLYLVWSQSGLAGTLKTQMIYLFLCVCVCVCLRACVCVCVLQVDRLRCGAVHGGPHREL